MNAAIVMLLGVVCGLAYFSGLWWTIGVAISRRRSATWFLLSLGVRLILAGAAFVIAAGCGPLAPFCMLIGFWLARTWMIHRLGGRRHACS